MSDLESSELTVSTKRLSSEHFAPEDAPNPAPREREGLPASYRMRADAHYVEQLGGRRAERERERERGEAPRQSASAEPGEATHDPEVRERRGDRILAQLQEELATLASASAMLSNSSALARRLGADLVRVETWRASWLVKAHALVDARERAYLRARPVGPIVEQLRQGLMPECRLAGVTLQVSATDWNATVHTDESVLSAGITGAVLATLGLLGQQEGAVIRVTFEAAGGELRSVDVQQDEVTPGPSTVSRFFDLGWADRQGGWMAALGAVTARAAAQQHGGTAVFQPTERRGTSLRISLAKLH